MDIQNNQDNLMQIEQENQSEINVDVQQSKSVTNQSLKNCDKVKKHRRRFTNEFKQKVIAQLKGKSQSQIAEIYKIDRRLIGKWTKAEEKIKAAPNNGSSFEVFTNVHGRWPELEKRLCEWFKGTTE
jgi:hypothetical protein